MTATDGITYFGGVDMHDDESAKEVNDNLIEERHGNRICVRSKHSATRYQQGSGHGAFSRESTKRPVFITQEEEAKRYEALKAGKDHAPNPHLSEKKVGHGNKTRVTWKPSDT